MVSVVRLSFERLIANSAVVIGIVDVWQWDAGWRHRWLTVHLMDDKEVSVQPRLVTERLIAHAALVSGIRRFGS